MISLKDASDLFLLFAFLANASEDEADVVIIGCCSASERDLVSVLQDVPLVRRQLFAVDLDRRR